MINLFLLSSCVTNDSYLGKEYIYIEEMTLSQTECDELSSYLTTITNEDRKSTRLNSSH